MEYVKSLEPFTTSQMNPCGFDLDAPVKRHNKWRGAEPARKQISVLLNKFGIS
jgi:hypothetical protein